MTSHPSHYRRLPVIILLALVIGLSCVAIFLFSRKNHEHDWSSNLVASPPARLEPPVLLQVPHPRLDTNQVNLGSLTPMPEQSVGNAQPLRLLKDRTVNLAARAGAIDSLGKMRAVEAVEALLEIIDDGSEAITLKYKAARALGAIGDDKAVPTLAGLLENSAADTHLRVVSALALGSIGTLSASEALSRAEKDEDMLIRFKAVQALEKVDNSVSRETMARALNDSDIYVQARAIHTVGKLGGESSVATISQILESSDSDFIRIACMTALGSTKQEQAVIVLRQYTNSSSQLVSLNARQALERLTRGN